MLGRVASTAVALTALLGCAPPRPPPRPPGLPPTPATVTAANPGGDAADPELAALQRLDSSAWAPRRDRWGTIVIALADARHWQRVNLWGYPTRVAFRFGDEHYGITAVWYQRTAGPDDPESCLRRFVDEARPAAEAYGVHATATRLVRTDRPGGGTMVVQVIDATVDGLLGEKAYAGALAAYPSWPGTCLVQGFVVVAGEHHDLAVHVRDRWVAEGAPRLLRIGALTEAPATEAR
jgi:hypothetical protein